MSKLQELIERLCPEGVPYRQFGEVLEFRRGMTITEKDSTPGDYPVIAGGKKPAYFHNAFNRQGETIAVAGSGAYAGFVSWWTDPIFLSDAFSVHSKDGSLLPKFVFYYMKNMQEKIHNTKKGSGVPHVHGSSIAKFLIPIPPIEVQEEIVRILDTFTAHTAELQAELQARKEQYEYYRNLLLTFSPSAYGSGTDDEQKTNSVTTWGGHSYEIAWKTMGEICNFVNGFAFKSNLFREHGERIIRITNITGFNIDLSDSKYFNPNDYSSDLTKFKVSKGNILIAMSGATTGKIGCYMNEESCYINQRVGMFKPLTNILTERYLFHVLSTKTNEFYNLAGGGAQPNLSSNDLMKIVIPIPPIELQEKIVAVLDRFETLVNDLAAGLPAEIAAVKEQYEYYRNKLLTFKQIA